MLSSLFWNFPFPVSKWVFERDSALLTIVRCTRISAVRFNDVTQDHNYDDWKQALVSWLILSFGATGSICLKSSPKRIRFSIEWPLFFKSLSILSRALGQPLFAIVDSSQWLKRTSCNSSPKEQLDVSILLSTLKIQRY